MGNFVHPLQGQGDALFRKAVLGKRLDDVGEKGFDGTLSIHIASGCDLMAASLRVRPVFVNIKDSFVAKEPQVLSHPIRRRACAVVVYQSQLLVVRLADPQTGVILVTVPGGEIEDNEEAAAAAARETFEETGYHVHIDARRSVTARYDFNWGGQIYDCETQFFRATLADAWVEPRTIVDATYHRGAFWLNRDGFDAAFDYHTTIKQSVLSLL